MICKRHNMDSTWPYMCPCYWNDPGKRYGEPVYDATVVFPSTKLVFYTPDPNNPLIKEKKKKDDRLRYS